MDKPKRPYTVTPKVLAANRANLLKANAVDKAIRYRSTPQRLAACRANLLKGKALDKAIGHGSTPKRLPAWHSNLLKAHRVLRAAGDHSPAYGVCFRHGLYAVSLERSLELAGESRAEFDAHLERFDRAFVPQGALQKKLVRGAAEAAWRRLRVFRGQARWEMQSVLYRLRQATEPAGAGFTNLGWLEQYFAEAPLGSLDRAQLLAEEIQGIFMTDYGLFKSLGQTNHRLERLFRVFYLIRNPADPPFEYLTHPRRRDLELLEQPGEALHNPFLTPRQVALALQRKRQAMKRFEAESWGEREERGGNRGPFCEGLAGQGKALSYGLMRRAMQESPKLGAPGPAPEGARAGEGPGELTFEAFLQLWQRAFHIENGNAKLENQNSQIQTANSEIRNPKLKIENPESPIPDPATRVLAALAWERLQVYGRRAEEEAENLKQILEAEIENQKSKVGFETRNPRIESGNAEIPSPESKIPSPESHAPAAKILALFASHLAPLDTAFDLAQRLWGGFYKLFRKRYGKRPQFDLFKPLSRRQREEVEGKDSPLDIILSHLDAGEEHFEEWRRGVVARAEAKLGGKIWLEDKRQESEGRRQGSENRNQKPHRAKPELINDQ